ncbi:MAG: hypothetical protein ACR2PC_13925 [Tsuneonella suprasediminis]
MKRSLFLVGGATALALVSALAMAQDAPESLLPPGFEDPRPAPTPAPSARPTSRPTATPQTPSRPANGGNTPSAASTPIVQPLPQGAATAGEVAGALPTFNGKLPSLEQLESMSTDDLDEALGLKPKVDIPPAARRSMEQVGVLAPAEGGLPTFSLARQPAQLVRAALAGTKGPVVSRWGHILLRRALASRLAAPQGMDPAEFAALRAALLNRIGEFAAARAVVQDVDTANWNLDLTNAAVDAYIGTADLVGACPVVRLKSGLREDPTWHMLQAICNSYAGEAARARTDLNRLRSRGKADRIDMLLAQRFAGAAGQQRAAVTIEWDGVDELTPWRFALANAVGETIPEKLLQNPTPYYMRASATVPMLGLPQRIAAADLAGREGILSARAMIDLYAQLHAETANEDDGPPAQTARTLRQAYVGADDAARMNAIRTLWGGKTAKDYSRLVLTAYAAARVEPSADHADDAGELIASMLSAGLDRNALRWANVVDDGSEGWALLALAAPEYRAKVGAGAIGSFASDDDSSGRRRAKFLLAGLAGLGRMDQGDIGSAASDLGVNLTASTKWATMIDRAAQVDNKALVALLAGVGMQGTGWEQMTPRHLYHIVSALNRVGLSAEARMIAAEAVARA